MTSLFHKSPFDRLNTLRHLAESIRDARNVQVDTTCANATLNRAPATLTITYTAGREIRTVRLTLELGSGEVFYNGVAFPVRANSPKWRNITTELFLGAIGVELPGTGKLTPVQRGRFVACRSNTCPDGVSPREWRILNPAKIPTAIKPATIATVTSLPAPKPTRAPKNKAPRIVLRGVFPDAVRTAFLALASATGVEVQAR